MQTNMQGPVLFIGGAGLPVDKEYGPLLEVLGGGVNAVVKDLEAFAAEPSNTATPSLATEDWTLEFEAETLRDVAAAQVPGPYHVVAYSGGGAVAFAFAALYPRLVKSLGLVDPAWAGADTAPDEQAMRESLDAIWRLPREQQMDTFRRLMVRPEVADSLPPLRPDAPWIGPLLDGIQAMAGAFRRFPLTYESLQHLSGRVYCAVGAQSNPVFEARAWRLQERLPGTRVEVYEGLHHLYPPHRGAPERFAAGLRSLWAKAEDWD